MVWTSAIKRNDDIIPTSLLSKHERDNIIYYHLDNMVAKRMDEYSNQQFPISPELSNIIIAQIKVRIHTQITSKISTKIFQKVKASLKIKASILGTIIQINNAEIEAIQTATVSGLEVQISQVIDEKFNKVISDKISPDVTKLLPSNQKTISGTDLNKMISQAETIARTQIQINLPEIQKTLKSCIDTHLKTHIRKILVDIPDVLKIQISAKINIKSSVQTVVQNVYKSYADVSIAIVIQSYIKIIQQKLIG